jgi:hypothetical protein
MQNITDINASPAYMVVTLGILASDLDKYMDSDNKFIFDKYSPFIIGDTAYSPIYIVQSTSQTTTSNQRIKLNGDVYIKNREINTPSTTYNIVAGTGITLAMLENKVIKIQGSGGAVDISANPQIADGIDGQVIELWGKSNTNTVKLDTGNGLQLAGGTSFTLGLGDVIVLRYFSDVDLWIEISRSDN